MKSVAARALIFGVLVTVLFALTTYLLLIAASKLSAPSPLSWLFVAFMAGGAPLAWLVQQIPGASFAWLPNPGDGPVGHSMSILAFCACLSWPVYIGGLRYLFLRRSMRSGA